MSIQWDLSVYVISIRWDLSVYIVNIQWDLSVYVISIQWDLSVYGISIQWDLSVCIISIRWDLSVCIISIRWVFLLSLGASWIQHWFTRFTRLWKWLNLTHFLTCLHMPYMVLRKKYIDPCQLFCWWQWWWPKIALWGMAVWCWVTEWSRHLLPWQVTIVTTGQRWCQWQKWCQWQNRDDGNDRTEMMPMTEQKWCHVCLKTSTRQNYNVNNIDVAISSLQKHREVQTRCLMWIIWMLLSHLSRNT